MAGITGKSNCRAKTGGSRSSYCGGRERRSSDRAAGIRGRLPSRGVRSDVVRLAAFAQFLIMNQSGFRAKWHRRAIAEGPFAAVAIIGANIAVDIETAAVEGTVHTGGVDQIGIPQGEVPRLENQVDHVLRRQASLRQSGIVHRGAKHLGLGVQWQGAAPVAPGNEAHAAGLRVVRIDCETGLDIGAAEVAIGRFWQAETRILMPGEISPAARLLPMELIDDLL